MGEGARRVGQFYAPGVDKGYSSRAVHWASEILYPVLELEEALANLPEPEGEPVVTA